MFYQDEKSDHLTINECYFNMNRGNETNHKPLLRRLDSSSQLSMQKSPHKRRVTISGWQDIKCVPKRRRVNSVALPTKFLLGGNIKDPLNLKSLGEDKGSPTINSCTPASSPLPVSKLRTQVKILIPSNIYDPLNLNTGEEIEFNMIPTRARKRKRHRRSNSRKDFDIGKESVFEETESFSECANAVAKIDFFPEEIVNEKETTDELPSVCEVKLTEIEVGETTSSEVSNSEFDISVVNEEESKASCSDKSKVAHLEKSPDDKVQADKIVSPVVPQGSKVKKRTPLVVQPEKNKKNKLKKKISCEDLNIKPENSKFSHGSYPHRYHCNKSDDVRFKFFEDILFSAKDVLDIGCNIGCMTALIAKNYGPRKIIGIDFDEYVVNAAQQHLLQHLNSFAIKKEKFPASLTHRFGPLHRITLPIEIDERKIEARFPHNVSFIQENYVLQNDEDIQVQQPEFDIILCLRVTKWIHLNEGDEGLKRSFKRMFAQLRWGGQLILEPQPWKTYAQAKNLSVNAHINYNSIKFRPEMFIKYLLSKEVGFSSCKLLGRIMKNHKGHRQSLYVLYKAMNLSPAHDMQHCQDASAIVFNDIEWARHLEEQSENSCEWDSNTQSRPSSPADFIIKTEESGASCYDLCSQNETFFDNCYFFPPDFDSNQDIY